MTSNTLRFAVVTGASTSIGFELAPECVEHGFDVMVAANEHTIAQAADRLRLDGSSVQSVEADLSNKKGLEKQYAAIGGRQVDALLALDSSIRTHATGCMWWRPM